MPASSLTLPARKSATRFHLDAEKRDMHDLLMRAAVAGQSAVQALVDLADQRVYADERREGLRDARNLCGAIIDSLNDFVSPIRQRADDAGLDPDDYRPDLSELEALYEKLKGVA